MATPSVHLRITPTRLAAFEFIWQRIPHLKGSVAETIDFLCGYYANVESRHPNQIAQIEVKPNVETEETTPTVVGEDEWA